MFICCASFENRCRSIVDIVSADSLDHILIAYNTNLSDYIDENLNYLCKKFNDHAESVPINSRDPLTTADALYNALKKIPDENYHYLIDITTFTHESLLMLFRLLTELKKNKCKFTFVYTGATNYGIDQENLKDKWLSKGIHNIRSVLGYPGELLPSRKDHLIVLVGYEHERASRLIEDYEPNKISLGFGRSKSIVDSQLQEAQSHFNKLAKEISAKYGSDCDFEFSCNDPSDARDEILKCIETTPDHNHIIAPMNTKISTIGCALATIEDPTIQLCYAQPTHYNYKHYASPGDTCYLINLNDS